MGDTGLWELTVCGGERFVEISSFEKGTSALMVICEHNGGGGGSDD